MDLVALAEPRVPGKTSPSAGQHLGRRDRVGLRLCLALIALALLATPSARAAGAQPSGGQTKPLSVDPPADAAVQRRIEGILAALGGVEELEVEVRSGVVRIGGRAQSLAVREQATELAQRVDGVVVVRNQLYVASQLRDRLRPTWLKLKGYLSRTLGFLPVLVVALLAFGAFAALSSALGRWERPFRRLGLSRLGLSAVRVPLRAVLLLSGVIVALDILGLVAFVGTVVGALGVIGVLAGIAFRDVVSNYLPGIMLGMSPPFGPGDHVQIGEHEGRVVRVTSRETILVRIDGQHLRIPNVRLLQEPIVNFERHRERRLKLLLEVALSADLRRVREVGRETLLSLTGILREPRPSMHVMTVGADQVQVAFFAWADQRATRFVELESRARQAVKEALLAAHVPFPMQEITVHSPAEATVESLGEEESDGLEEELLADHFREERAEPGARDLLSEGRSGAK